LSFLPPAKPYVVATGLLRGRLAVALQRAATITATESPNVFGMAANSCHGTATALPLYCQPFWPYRAWQLAVTLPSTCTRRLPPPVRRGSGGPGMTRSQAGLAAASPSVDGPPDRLSRAGLAQARHPEAQVPPTAPSVGDRAGHRHDDHGRHRDEDEDFLRPQKESLDSTAIQLGDRALSVRRLCRGCGRDFSPRRASQACRTAACRATASRGRRAARLQAVLKALDRGAVGEARGELRRLLGHDDQSEDGRHG